MITEALGIKGWGSINDRMILTSIVTGDPLLIVNKFGQGKTAIVDRLGQVITKQLKKYRPNEKMTANVINVATANPQDWAGYLIPPKELDGTKPMVLIESPQSLLNAVLIATDEMGRTQARNQNNVLSLIQERRVDGIPTKCEILFAMMNPVMSDDTDEGSEPLIGPLADRFALMIEPPNFDKMNIDDKKEVIYAAYKPHSSKSIFTDPKDKVLGKDEYVVSDEIIDKLWEFFVKAKKLYIEYCFASKNEKLLESVVEYVAMVSTQLPKSQVDTRGGEIYISGRRAGFLTRAILANHAVGIVSGKENLPAAAELVLLHSAMNKSMGIGINPQRLIAAHKASLKVLTSGGSIMANIMAEPNKWKRLQIAHHSRLTPDQYTRIYKDVWTLYANNSYIEVVMGMVMINDLAKKMSKHELAEIGRDVIDVCNIPIKQFSIDTSSPEALEIALEIQSNSDMMTLQATVLAHHIMKRLSISFVEAWTFVMANYKKVVAVLNNDEEFNYES